MKKLRFMLALVALLPASSLLPACSVEATDEGDTTAAEDAELDTPDLEPLAPIGCTKESFVGAGSCHVSCTKIGLCLSGRFKWQCTAQGYEHWKGTAGEDNYFKIGGTFQTGDICSYTHPGGLCPGFCN
jgi:hypothetical protein